MWATDLTKDEFKAVTLKGISVQKLMGVTGTEISKDCNTAQTMGIIRKFGNVKYNVKDWIYGRKKEVSPE